MLRSAALLPTALVVGVLVWLPALAVSAQVDPYADLTTEEAEELLDIIAEADAARDAGRWAAALGGYQEFLLRINDPFIRLEAAVCLVELGRLQDADEAYSDVRSSGDEEAAQRAADAQRALRSAHPQTVAFEVSPDTAYITVIAENGETRTTRPGADFALTAGDYSVRVEARGFVEMERRISVTLEGPQTITFALEPEPVAAVEAPAVPDEDAPDANRSAVPVSPDVERAVGAARSDRDTDGARVVPAVTLAVASAASLGVAGYYFSQVSAREDEFNNYFASEPLEQQSIAAWRSIGRNGQRAQRIAIGAAAAGGTLAVLSVVTGVVMNRDRDDVQARNGALQVDVASRQVAYTLSW